MTKQAPIQSGFNARTTAKEALGGRSLEGKTAIVTGGYSGIGLETTRALAEAGATVIVPARSPDKAKVALSGIANVVQESLDLAHPESIAAFAQRFLNAHRSLDILINNAAIMASPLMRDDRGYEAQFATNHLGHFQLAALLAGAFSRGARVVALSSIGHRRSGVNFEDPNFINRDYDKWEAYGQAKTANALFAIGLDARFKDRGVRAFAVHPGGIMTDLQRFMPKEEQFAMGWIDETGKVNDRFKSTEQGAATSVWCAAHPRLEGEGGVYCEDCDVAEATPADAPGWSGVRPWAIDPVQADRLWTLSEELTGVRFQ